jgi:hypothetical protein
MRNSEPMVEALCAAKPSGEIAIQVAPIFPAQVEIHDQNGRAKFS